MLGEMDATETDLQNRRRIVEAGHHIFSVDGFYGARVVDIAAEAKLGIGTVYRHFGSKADIFEAVIRGTIDQIYEDGSQTRSQPSDAMQRVSAANRSYLEGYYRSSNLMATLNHLATQDKRFRTIYLETRARAVARLQHAIERLQEGGQADPHLDATVAAEALIAMMQDIAFTDIHIKGSSVDEIDVDMLDMLWARALGLNWSKA